MSAPDHTVPRLPGGLLRYALTLLAGVAAVVALLTLPAPTRGPAAPPGPPTLASVWPGVKPFPIAATFPDGSAFYPLVVVDPQTVLGLAQSSDGLRSDLVVAGPTGAPRLLEQVVIDSGKRVGPYAATADAFYWMSADVDDLGDPHFSLWTAPRRGGAPRRVSADVGEPIENNSQYDMQIVGDRLYWISGDDAGAYQLRWIALSGGPVGSRPLPGQWQMLAWPWLATAPGVTATPGLWNLDTGEHRQVSVSPGRIVFCSLSWCRTIGSNVDNAGSTELARPDGSDRQVLGGQDTIAVANDVAALDRFEPLMIPLASGYLTNYRVLLYDIAHRRTVHIEDNASDAYAMGDFLWWSTGDNETTAWYGLDLRALR